MMVNARKSFTVRELADELGISMRTITRDLQELSELGVPIYSIQGRGGGYKLLRERMLPPISGANRSSQEQSLNLESAPADVP